MSDDDSVPYQPVQIDYMRDVFRPKQFVKETKEVKPKELYQSVYDNLNVKRSSDNPIRKEDDPKALELYEFKKSKGNMKLIFQGIHLHLFLLLKSIVVPVMNVVLQSKMMGIYSVNCVKWFFGKIHG